MRSVENSSRNASARKRRLRIEEPVAVGTLGAGHIHGILSECLYRHGGAFRFCHADCTFYKEITMRWKKDEIEYLIAHAGKMKNKELSLIMGRPIESIKNQKKRLGLTMECHTGPYAPNWTGITPAERKREYRKQNPDKDRANQIVRIEKKHGRLVPQPCEVCGKEKVDAHHEDYSKPLEVVWLCKKHHRQLHIGTIHIEDVRGKHEEEV